VFVQIEAHKHQVYSVDTSTLRSDTAAPAVATHTKATPWEAAAAPRHRRRWIDYFAQQPQEQQQQAQLQGRTWLGQVVSQQLAIAINESSTLRWMDPGSWCW
jgi:hypothetical protein